MERNNLLKNKALQKQKCFFYVKLRLKWCAEVQAEIEGDLGSQPFDLPPLLEIAICILQITHVDK